MDYNLKHLNKIKTGHPNLNILAFIHFQNISIMIEIIKWLLGVVIEELERL